MKINLLILTIIITTSSPILGIARPNKPNRPENARIVLSNLAQMLGQIGNIIESPHNADNVGQSVSNIVDNIIKITVNAVQKRTISIDDACQVFNKLEQVCQDCDKEIIHSITSTRKKLIA